MHSLKSACPWVWVGLGALLLLDQQPAHAYLDPGTGSYVFQAVVAAVLGGLVALKVFWRNLVRWARHAPPEAPDEDEDE